MPIPINTTQIESLEDLYKQFSNQTVDREIPNQNVSVFDLKKAHHNSEFINSLKPDVQKQYFSYLEKLQYADWNEDGFVTKAELATAGFSDDIQLQTFGYYMLTLLPDYLDQTPTTPEICVGVIVSIVVAYIYQNYQEHTFNKKLKDHCGHPVDSQLNDNAKMQYDQFVKEKLAFETDFVSFLRKIFQNQTAIHIPHTSKSIPLFCIVNSLLVAAAEKFGFPLLENTTHIDNSWVDISVHSTLVASGLLALHNAGKPTYNDFFENGFDASICEKKETVEEPHAASDDLVATKPNLSSFIYNHPIASAVTALGAFIFAIGWITPGIPDGEAIGAGISALALGYA